MATMKTQNAPAKTTRKTNQKKALDAFCHHVANARKLLTLIRHHLANARKLLTLIRRHLDDHMTVKPDDVNWANVGDAARLHKALKEIAATFNLI